MWIFITTLLCLRCAYALLAGITATYPPIPEPAVFAQKATGLQSLFNNLHYTSYNYRPNDVNTYSPKSRPGSGSYAQGDTGIYQNYYLNNDFCREPPCIPLCRYPPCIPFCRYPPCQSPSNNVKNAIHNYSPNNNNFNIYSPKSRSGTGPYTQGDTGTYQNYYPDNNFCRDPPCIPLCRYPPCQSPSNNLKNTMHNYSPNNNNFNTYSPKSRSGSGSYAQGDTGIYQNYYLNNDFCKEPPCIPLCRYPPCIPFCRYSPCQSPSNNLKNAIHNYSPNNNNFNTYSPKSRSGTGSYTQGDTGTYQNYYPGNNFCRDPPCIPLCRYPPCQSPSNNLKNTIHNYSPNNNNFNTYSPKSRSGTGPYTQGDTEIYQNYYPDHIFCRDPPCIPCRYPPCKPPSHNLQNTIHSYSPNNNNFNTYSPKSRSGTGSYTQGDTGIYQNYYSDSNFCIEPPCPPPCRYPPCPPPCRYPPCPPPCRHPHCNAPSNDLQNTIHNYSPNNNNLNIYSPSSKSGTGSYTQGDTGIYQNNYPDYNFCRDPPCTPLCRYPPCKPPSNDLKNTIHNYSPNNNNFNTYSPSFRSGTGSYTQGDSGIFQNYYLGNIFCREPPCTPLCRYPPCQSPSNNLKNTIHNYSPNNNNFNTYSPKPRSGTGSYTQGDTGIYQNYYPDNYFCRDPPCTPICRYPPCQSPLNNLQNIIHKYSPNNNNFNTYSPKSRSGTGSYTHGDTGIYQNYRPDNNYCKDPPCTPLCRYPPCQSPSNDLKNTIHSFNPNNINYYNYSPNSGTQAGSYVTKDTEIHQMYYPDNYFCSYTFCYPPFNNIHNTIHDYSPSNINYNNYSPNSDSKAGSYIHGLRANNAGRRESWYTDNPFDTSYFDEATPIEAKNGEQSSTYVEDLALIENFGTYLLKRTEMDHKSGNTMKEYNALFTVLVALARTIKDSCDDFDEIYEQVYYPTIDKYFSYGMENADKVHEMIEDYIKQGNSRMPKLRKLVLELCSRELYCSESVEEHIKSSPHVFIKELETLDALSHLARSFYPYIEEFDQAANNRTVHTYLKNSKDRLKEYVKHMVNSVYHLTENVVIC